MTYFHCILLLKKNVTLIGNFHEATQIICYDRTQSSDPNTCSSQFFDKLECLLYKFNSLSYKKAHTILYFCYYVDNLPDIYCYNVCSEISIYGFKLCKLSLNNVHYKLLALNGIVYKEAFNIFNKLTENSNSLIKFAQKNNRILKMTKADLIKFYHLSLFDYFISKKTIRHNIFTKYMMFCLSNNVYEKEISQQIKKLDIKLDDVIKTFHFDHTYHQSHVDYNELL